MNQDKPKIKHVITGMEWSTTELHDLIAQAKRFSSHRRLGLGPTKDRMLGQGPTYAQDDVGEFSTHLKGKALILLFEKPSFRTRLSFMRAMQCLGGEVIESVSSTRKTEAPADLARVLNGYADVVMVRAHEEAFLLEMASASTVPLINGLSALHHPCQALADLCALSERYGSLDGLTLSYIGDGNNVLHSLLLLAPKVGVHVRYCCPKTRQPDAVIVKMAKTAYPALIQSYDSPIEAVSGAQAVYTDVWHSMGMGEVDEHQFDGFQVNEALMALSDNAVFMHCMPMERGKEVSCTLPDTPCSIVFSQSEYRLYAQMAVLLDVFS
ncbi:MAG: ornithine carbamoyltransferase [Gammaproteobacteria bacterium]|nr:ornithine carbamoyltransferase [Gammaproteobacteria bacterium]